MKTSLLKQLIVTVNIVSSLFIFCIPKTAQAYTFINNAPGDWNLAETWLITGLPTGIGAQILPTSLDY